MSRVYSFTSQTMARFNDKIIVASLLFFVLNLANAGNNETAKSSIQSRDWAGGISMCGCESCTNTILNLPTGTGSTCLGLILDLIFHEHVKMTEQNACIQVAREHPQCASCDSASCDANSQHATAIPPAVEAVEKPYFCGCLSCTTEEWNQLTDTFTCGERIDWLQNTMNMPMKDACHRVSGVEFPAQCSKCDPVECNQNVSGNSFGQANEQTAPSQAQNEPKPVSSPSSVPSPPLTIESPPSSSPSLVPNTRCGCSNCTEDVYNKIADGYSCAARMDFLLRVHPSVYPTEADSCKRVAFEFPDICGICACDGHQRRKLKTHHVLGEEQTSFVLESAMFLLVGCAVAIGLTATLKARRKTIFIEFSNQKMALDGRKSEIGQIV